MMDHLMRYGKCLFWGFWSIGDWISGLIGLNFLVMVSSVDVMWPLFGKRGDGGFNFWAYWENSINWFTDNVLFAISVGKSPDVMIK